MDTKERLKNADQHSRELIATFTKIEHKARELEEFRQTIQIMHEQLAALQTELKGIKADVSSVQSQMPTIARKEEVQRLQSKLDNIPFELLATKKDL
jgi:hypothetical protein